MQPIKKSTVYLIILFSTISLLYSFSASIVVAKFEHFFNESIYLIKYGFGPLTESIVKTGKYHFYNNDIDIYFTAHRYPLIPIFLYLIHFLTTNTFITLLIKNSITGLVLTYCILRIFRMWGKNKAIILLLTFATPRFVIHAFNIYHEEAFVTPLLSLISVLLCTTQRKPGIQIDDIIYCVACSLFIFTKSSSIYLGVALTIFWYLQRRTKSAFVMSTLFAMSTFLTIAIFSYINNGHFTLDSSINGYNIYKGNNPKTLELYPEITLDVLETTTGAIPTRRFANEWDFNSFYKEKANAYIKSNPEIFIKGVFIKSMALFFWLKPFAKDPNPNVRIKPGIVNTIDILSIVIHRIIFIVSLLVAILILLSTAPVYKRITALIFVLFIGLYSGPFMIGFAYMRHYVPLMFPVAVFGLRLFSDRFPKLFQTNSKIS